MKLFILLLVLALTSSSAFAIDSNVHIDDADLDLVGNFDDLSKLTFKGLKTFSDKQIISGLLEDFDFLLSTHPFAPLQDYLKIIEEKITEGYKNAGFSEAIVTAHINRRYCQVDGS